jgi:hypothetical protein
MPPHEKSPKGGNPPGFVCFRLIAGVTKVALLIVATIVLSAKPRLKGHHTDLGMPLCPLAVRLPSLGRVPATGRAGRLLRMAWSTLRFDQAMLHRAPCRVSALRVTIPHAYAPAALRIPSGLAFSLPPALPSGKGASRPLSSRVQDGRPSAFFPAPMTGASGRFNPRQWFATPLSSPGRGPCPRCGFR